MNSQHEIDEPLRISTPSNAPKGHLWSGSLKTMVIFGASYSVFSYWDDADVDDNEMTWAGCLQEHWKRTDRKIFNLSVPGLTAANDLEMQLGRFFRECQTPLSKPALDPSTTTYVFFLGINDCAQPQDKDNLDTIVKKILDTARRLYVDAGARDFIFMNVPPTNRSPIVAWDSASTLKDRIAIWNARLQARVSDFAREHTDANVFLFSFHAILTHILDHPEEYNFSDEDTIDDSGYIWMDGLHLRAAVHNIITDKLLEGAYGLLK